MIRSYGLIALLLLPVALMAAEQGGGGGDPKMVSGMSILGNDDAPKSLYIVPWKTSEIGSETKLSSNLLNADMTPVDKTVFMRELDFYNVSNAK